MSAGAGTSGRKRSGSGAGRAGGASMSSGSRAGGSKQRIKVGASPKAAAKFGGKLDFGIPADRARAPRNDGGRTKGPIGASGPMREEGAAGRREAGVGWARGPAGSGSGGDASGDFTGAGTGGSTVTESGSIRESRGADDAQMDNGDDDDREVPAHIHGATERVEGTTHNGAEDQM
jgi:hypothetical protein